MTNKSDVLSIFIKWKKKMWNNILIKKIKMVQFNWDGEYCSLQIFCKIVALLIVFIVLTHTNKMVLWNVNIVML